MQKMCQWRYLQYSGNFASVWTERSDFPFALLVETFLTKCRITYSLIPICLSSCKIVRGCGTMILLIRKELACFFLNLICMKYDSKIALLISKPSLYKYWFIILGVNISPMDSPYYKDTDIYNGIVMFEEHLAYLNEKHSDFQILLGDFNAWTGG